ncbi:MAG: class I SAM-dependent rRNA methyltransferase [Desulfobulbaceae bacterium]|nr:class I SAM-dependent rRNA methyltransferase [Desulfobulbaceae bacterium]
MGDSDKLIPKIQLKKYHNKYQSGYLWIFSNELVEVPKIEAGTLVEAIAGDKVSLGLAFYNPNSLISLRLLLTDANSDVSKLIKYRIIGANNRRKQLLANSDSYRMVFGESDLLPGLIIDKYGSYYAVQIQSAGFESMKKLISDTILEIDSNAKGIILKANSKSREIEGLSTIDEILFGEIPELIQIKDREIKININISDGQKTGYFLDQCKNRHLLSQISRGKKVLDCFTHIGGFSLNAAYGGATEITAVDSSASAIELAKINAANNNYNINFITQDVFDFFKNNSDKKWDIIVLDPPAFAKNKKSVSNAKAAYLKMNQIALEALAPSGILLTASCSHHIYEDVFYDIITRAALRADKTVNMIYRGSQAPDHPVYPPMPETSYLKFYALQSID